MSLLRLSFISVILASIPQLHSQVVPTTPTGFSSRKVGAASGSASVSVQAPQRPAPQVITITYLTLSPPRQFTSVEGKPLLAKVIAWEDFQVTGNSTEAPALTSPPTVLKGGKARLLVNQKPYEIEVKRLIAADQQYLAQLHATAALSQPKPNTKTAASK